MQPTSFESQEISRNTAHVYIEWSDCTVRLHGSNQLEVWESDVSQHYLITFDNRKPEIDVVFIAQE